jgi:hypothetical protein
MAALNRFISKLGERGLPFFKLLKHQEKFMWTLEADQALTQLRHYFQEYSPSSMTTRSVTSCGTKMLLDESPNGQSNSAPLTSTSCHKQP